MADELGIMSWDTFIKRQMPPRDIETFSLVPIECPNCGGHVFRRNNKKLMSDPPMYEYHCFSCGWIGRHTK